MRPGQVSEYSSIKEIRHETYLVVVEVLTRVDSLVFDHLDDSVHAKRQQGTQKRANPVDVVVSREVPCNHAGSEASGRVQATTSVENTNQLGNE